MKTTYMKPVTDVVVLAVKKAFLQDDVITTGGSNYGKYSDAAEGNMGAFSSEDDENDLMFKSTNLWDE